ncbi:unnamed protein product, partial [Allacma fusca]
MNSNLSVRNFWPTNILTTILFTLVLFKIATKSEPLLNPPKSTTLDLQELLPPLINCFVRIFDLGVTFDYSALTVPFILTNAKNYPRFQQFSDCDFDDDYIKAEKLVEKLLTLKLSSIKCFAGIILHENNGLNSGDPTEANNIMCLFRILGYESSLRYFKTVKDEIFDEKKLLIFPRMFFLYTNDPISNQDLNSGLDD